MANTHNSAPQTQGGQLFSLAMLGALFFVFGMVTWVNSVLIPYFKIACDLHNEVLTYLVTFAFSLAYLVMTIPASMLLNRVGFKRGVEYGLWILATGAVIFMPAALTRSYGIFLTGLFTMGTGLAVLQTAANPFVTIIGPIESAAQRISIMGICNKFAGIVVPWIFASLVISKSDEAIMEQVKAGLLTGAAREEALDQMILGVIPPYVGLAIILFIFGIIFYKSSIPDIDPKKDNKSSDASANDRESIFAYPYLILGALALMAHVGSQQISVSTIISYAESMGIDFMTAKIFPSATLACILIGYLTGTVLIPKYLSQQKALLICTVVGLILSFCVVLCPPIQVHLFGFDTDVSIWFLVLLGLPNSLIYAGIWPLAIRNLGRHTNLGSSLLVMGLFGNALLPLIYGYVADHTSLQLGYWTLIPCFLYMIYYAVWGYKIEYWTKPKE